MLDEYYRLMEWVEDGVPTPERLAALGLAGANYFEQTEAGGQ